MLNHNHLRAAAMAGLTILISTGIAATAATPATDIALLEQIPSTAQAVVMIHNPESLHAKVATLCQKLKIPVLPPPLRQIEKSMNLPRSIEAHGSIAIVAMPDGSANDTAHTVIIASAKDPAAAIANANMHLAFGKDGLAHGQSADGRDIYAIAGKKCVLVSHDRAALLKFEAVAESMAPMLTKSEQPLAEHSDVYALLNIAACRKPLEKQIDKSEARDERAATNPSHIRLEKLGKRAVFAMLNCADSALFGLRISSDAITQSVVADTKPGTDVAEVLNCLRPLPSTPFVGLPDMRNMLGLSAKSIDGPRAAAMLNHWASQITTAEGTTKDKYGIAHVLSQIAIVVHDVSIGRSVAVISSKATGPLYSMVEIAHSSNGHESAAILTQLLVKEMALINKIEAGVGMHIHYRSTVSAKPIIISKVPFTAIRQVVVPPTGGSAQANAMRHALAMQQTLTGVGKQTILVGSKGDNLIIAANMNEKLMTDAIKAADTDTDALVSRPQIMAAAKHVLANSSVIAYIDLSPVISAIAQRVEAMAKMNAMALKMPATEPMSFSLASHDGTLYGKMRMPMKNLEQLSVRVHALLPLLMMMEMQAMQGGQGGANPIQ